MVAFGVRLRSVEPEWRERYIRYEELKDIIESFAAELRRAASSRSRSLGDVLSGMRTSASDTDFESDGARTPPPGGHSNSGNDVVTMLSRNVTMGGLRVRTHSETGGFSGLYDGEKAGSLEVTKKDQMRAFGQELDRNITGIVCFALEQQGRVATHVQQLIGKRRGLEAKVFRRGIGAGGRVGSRGRLLSRSAEDIETGVDEAYSTLVRELCDAGRNVVRLINFLELNVTGVRKILKKFDKVLRMSLASRYLQSRSGPWGVLNGFRNHGLYTLAGVVATQLRDLSAIEAAKVEMDGLSSFQDMGELRARLRRAAARAAPAEVLEALHEARDRMEESQQRMTTDYIIVTSRVELEGSLVRRRRENAAELDSYTSGLRPGLDGEVVPVAKAEADFNLFRDWSHLLNFASTFLYMSNLYIVGPTSGSYAEELGGSTSLSAMVIGCTPFMAAVSCVGYSYWTNFSFKRPLILCAFLMAVGNAMYASAEAFDSLGMMLAGRMVNGLGGARGINRRFIADCTSAKQRVDASAAFVAAGALGMAFGPAACAVLKLLPTFTVYGSLEVNELTAPGYFMTGLWFTYLALITFFFREPERETVATKKSEGESEGEGDDGAAASADEARPLLASSMKKKKYGSAGNGNGKYASPAVTSPHEGYLVTPMHGRNGSSETPPTLADKSNHSSSKKEKEDEASPEEAASGMDTPLWRSESIDIPYDHPRRDPPTPLQLVGAEDVDEEVLVPVGVLEAPTGRGGSSFIQLLRRSLGCCLDMDAGVVLCLMMFFCNKLVVEVLISSAPSITRHRFDFTTSECSAMMAVFGILVLPTNAILSYISSRHAAFARQLENSTLGAHHEDFTSRDGETDLILTLGFAVALALLLLLDIEDVGMELHADRYIFGVMLGFVVLQAQEGVLLSKLSKIVAFRQPGYARGTCNSGLLATESGTLGRVLGDVFITLIASNMSHASGSGWNGHPNTAEGKHTTVGLVNGIFGPSLAFLFLCLGFLHRYRSAVAV